MKKFGVRLQAVNVLKESPCINNYRESSLQNLREETFFRLETKVIFLIFKIFFDFKLSYQIFVFYLLAINF